MKPFLLIYWVFYAQKYQLNQIILKFKGFIFIFKKFGYMQEQYDVMNIKES